MRSRLSSATVNGVTTGEITTETSTLLDHARSGDADAFTALYERFFPAARRAAVRCVRDQHEADDVSQEAFYQVFRAIRAGHGPDQSFLGYLLSTIRRLASRHSAQRGKTVITDDVAAYEPRVVDSAAAARSLDDVAAALFDLPDRWREILWLIDVEQYSPAELAGELQMSPTAVSSLGTRAREALRTAFLAQQVMDDAGRCAQHAQRLAAFVRGTLATRWIPKLTEHLDSCATCRNRMSRLAEDSAQAGLAAYAEADHAF